MSTLRITTLAATLITAASLAAGAAIPASAAARPPAQIRPDFAAYGYGNGATSLIAYAAAKADLLGSNYGCGTIYLVYDNQLPDGTWTAEVTAGCRGGQ